MPNRWFKRVTRPEPGTQFRPIRRNVNPWSRMAISHGRFEIAGTASEPPDTRGDLCR